MEKFPRRIVGGGAAMLAVVTALGWGGVSTIIRGQMKQQAKLYNNTDAWQRWQDSPSPYYLKVYFFHLENPDAVMSGGKPKVVEKGPYVYMESRWKEDISFDKGNDTLSYRQMRKYSFVPDLSMGLSENDKITTLNVPLVGVAKIALDAPDKDKMLAFVSSKTSSEKLVITHSVKELLLDGYDAKAYEELAKEHNKESPPPSEGAEASGGGSNFIPLYLADGKYSLFENRFLTASGVWEIWTGRTNGTAYGLFKTWNGMNTLAWWSKGEPCIFLNGTDGTLFTPPKPTTTLRIYESEYCRSRKYTFEVATKVKDVQTMRFRPKKEQSQSPKNNPDNACYCPYDDMDQCGRDGVEILTPCMEGVPLFVSNPHFLHADQEVLSKVDGMSPDPMKHETYLDIDPITGLIFEGKRRWQISLELEPVSGVSALSSAPKAYVPIYWIEESYMVPESKFQLLRLLYTIQYGCDQIRWPLLGTGGAILLIGLFLALVRKSSSKVDKITLLQ